MWRTIVQLKADQELIQWKPIKINRGIFQGDTVLIPVLHSAYIHLTHELNRSEYGHQVYGTDRKINKNGDLIRRRCLITSEKWQHL
jgi:hypothetical protein